MLLFGGEKKMAMPSITPGGLRKRIILKYQILESVWWYGMYRHRHRSRRQQSDAESELSRGSGRSGRRHRRHRSRHKHDSGSEKDDSQPDTKLVLSCIYSICMWDGWIIRLRFYTVFVFFTFYFTLFTITSVSLPYIYSLDNWQLFKDNFR